jgi:hypothetical protein
VVVGGGIDAGGGEGERVEGLGELVEGVEFGDGFGDVRVTGELPVQPEADPALPAEL